MVRLLFFLFALILSCRPTSKTLKTEYDFKKNNRVYFVLETSSGALSYEQAKIGNSYGTNVTSGQVMSGQQQIVVCAENMIFEMSLLGFTFVKSEAEADVKAFFSIGTVRYDALAGWIADQAFLKLNDKNSGSLVFAARSQSKLVTPTTTKLIADISSQLKKSIK